MRARAEPSLELVWELRTPGSSAAQRAAGQGHGSPSPDGTRREEGQRRDRGTQTPKCSTGLVLTQPRPSINTVALSVVFPGIWLEQRQTDFTRIKPTEKNLALDVSELLFNPETAQLSEFGI